MFYLCKTRTLFDLQLVKFGRSQIQRPSQNYTIKEEEVSLEETTPQTRTSILTSNPHEQHLVLL